MYQSALWLRYREGSIPKRALALVSRGIHSKARYDFGAAADRARTDRGVDGRPGCFETTRCAITHTATTPLEGCAGAVDYHSNSVEDFLLTEIVH